MKNEVFQEGALKVAEWKDMKLTFPHKHIKNTSNVKQFSLKTNWQKDSYSQGYKKIHTELEREGKQLGQDLGPWERIQMKMEITQADTCPGERAIQAIGCVLQSGVLWRGEKPLGLLEDLWNN